MSQFFDDSLYYTGPDLELAMIRDAEEFLGYKLPQAYIDLLFERNGGSPRRCCCPTDFPTSWADDHFEISGLLGIGGSWGINSSRGGGSPYLISEWGYPDIGIVICDTPSAGHDTVMLDYSSGPDEEPSVTYIDEDRIPRKVADSFGAFIARLVDCESLDS
ncbi:SMI1/KNR4 family protein [Kribbella sp. NPDC058245]|uniref:SMI1/KNR4 family protein n=1 Tax=Kribbella sp. NPDC058245 TaxID=3346399 RepID=UPI0036E9139C